MKPALKIITIALLALTCLTACRKEEIQSINVPEEDTLNPNSSVANLMQRVTLNDGSFDNILDKANCFNIKYPITVSANNLEVLVSSKDDLNDVESIFDRYDDDDDLVNLVFPLTIINTDFSEVVLANNTELLAFLSNCNGENESDLDIECVDFNYPFSVSIFNPSNELISAETFANDSQLYQFIGNINDSDIITINFPLQLKRNDNSIIQIENLTDLENSIANAINDCDEDDDYDYNDDDCNDCTTEQLTQLLTDCSPWTVQNLERSSNNDEDYYVGYTFDFMADGTINADYAAWSYSGTWTASGSGNNITVIVDIPSLPDCNNSWTLHEIKLDSQSKFDLNLGNDKLRYISACDSGNLNDTSFITAITAGNWQVSYYFDGTDQTSLFSDYTLGFISGNNRIVATDMSGSTYGYWSTFNGDETDLELNMNFGIITNDLTHLIEDWDVVQFDSNTIELKDISDGDGTVYYLTLQRL